MAGGYNLATTMTSSLQEDKSKSPANVVFAGPFSCICTTRWIQFHDFGKVCASLHDLIIRLKTPENKGRFALSEPRGLTDWLRVFNQI